MNAFVTRHTIACAVVLSLILGAIAATTSIWLEGLVLG